MALVAPPPVLSHELPPPPPFVSVAITKCVYVRYAHRSHGKQVIRKHCKSEAHRLTVAETYQLPSKNVVFYWIQREWQFADRLIKNYTSQPCVANIPLQRILCNKVEASEVMREYYGEGAWTFVPESYTIRCMNIEQQGYDYSEVQDVIARTPGEKWILKSNLGYFGTEVHVWCGETVEELHEFVSRKFVTNNFTEHFVDKMNPDNGRGVVVSRRGNDIVMQKYISNPLLCDGRKWDLRVYCLISSVDPCIAFFHKGKMRLSGVEYDEKADADAEWVHKTNCHIQRQHEDYVHHENAVAGNEMLRNWEEFLEWMFTVKDKFPVDWFRIDDRRFDPIVITLEEFSEVVEWKICEVLGKTIDAAGDYFDETTRLANRECSFAFHGADIMVDENGVFWWLETNRVPALNMAGPQTISDMTETMLRELVDIQLEIRNLKLAGVPILDENYCAVNLESVHCWKPITLKYYGKDRPLNDVYLETLAEPPPVSVNLGGDLPRLDEEI